MKAAEFRQAFCARFALFCAALSVIAFVSGNLPAVAQDEPATESEEAPGLAPAEVSEPKLLRSPILVISQVSLFTDSSAARSIADQAAAAESALEAELDVEGESLRNRERELSDLKTTLPKAEFDKLAAQFERDVRAFYARSQRERGLVDQAVSAARSKLRKGAQSVLIDIMRRHGALVMLDEEQLVLSVNKLDITQEAIENLNQVVPDVLLEFPEPDTQPER